MRHAAPRTSPDRKLNRAGQLILGAIACTITGLAVGLVTLGVTFAIWGLWQWMGVN